MILAKTEKIFPRRLFDAHCHLDQLPDPDEAVLRARRAGVERLLTVSEDPGSGLENLTIKARHPKVVSAALGIHPMLSVSLAQHELVEGLRFIEEHVEKADALGEVGLDFKYARSEEQQTFQRELLDQMLEMAKTARKPVNLHSRWAQRQTMEIAVQYKKDTGLPALLHWFTSSKKLIRICAEEGIFVSVGPSILFEGPASEVCLHIPDHLLLVETDSPVPYGGDPAEPAWIPRVFEKLSELRGTEPAVLERILNENFDRYLNL